VAEKLPFHHQWIPPKEPASLRGRELQAIWLDYQVGRLPLTDKERLKMTNAMAQAWDAWEVTPRQIKDFIDKEVSALGHD
jgi:hypothetical protein